MRDCVEIKAKECIYDVKTVMKKHGMKGKVRLILALSVLKCLAATGNNPWCSFYDGLSAAGNNTLFVMIPKYFEKNVWDEVMTCIFYYREEKYYCYNLKDVLGKAIDIAKCPKKKFKQDLIEEIISLSETKNVIYDPEIPF